MQRPRWLMEFGEGRRVLEGMLTIDAPDVKVVELRLEDETVLIAIGTRKNVDMGPVEKVERENGGMCWRLFYDRTAFQGFIPDERVRDLIAGAVALVSGSGSVYDTETRYIGRGKRNVKGDAPILLDYEVARRIEELKRSKMG